jgi:pimeloyl-ACP methyl ester carboxylesterase
VAVDERRCAFEGIFSRPNHCAALYVVTRRRCCQPEVLIAATWALACAGKFTWPIPDRGLRDRLHRISAPTLFVWGDKDQLVCPVYAQDFKAGLTDARLAIVENAGHALIHERPAETARAVVDFLNI